MKRIKWSLSLLSLLLLVFLILPGCAMLDTNQRGALDVVGTTPAPVQAGVKCRLLDGSIEAGAANVQGEGFRCSQYGNDGQEFKGCVTWQEDGIKFWSPGCFKQPVEVQEGVDQPPAPTEPEAPVPPG